MPATWTPASEAMKILEPLSSGYVGIVSREYQKLRDTDDVWGHSYGAHTTDGRALIGARSNAFNGGGSTTRTQARLAAIGETVERYSAAYCPPLEDARVRRGTASDLRTTGDMVLGPEAWEFFADEQFADPMLPHVRWTDDTSLWWREGADVVSGRRAWTPAQLVHLAGLWPEDVSISYATSNGLACGITETEARISGLFEAVERDAFMLTWYNRLSLPHVDVSTPRLERFISRYIRPTGLHLHLIDMSVFSGIPSVLAVVRNPYTGLAPVAIGAASAPSIERAAEKAATEGMYTRTWMKTEQREGNAIHSTDWAADITTFEDHIKLFAGTELVPEADFLTANTEVTGPNAVRSFDDSSPETLWMQLVEHLDRQGTPVVAFDLTSPDILEAGARVSKIVLPGYRQLDATYTGRMLGGSRIREESHRLGLVPEPFEYADLNHIPHPFP